MTYPVVEYVNAAAGTTDFDVPFPFLSSRHVEVLVNDAQAYILEWIVDRRLRLSAPVQPTDVVTIQRNTPIETALVQFQDGAVLTQEDLNTAVTQLLYKQQELQALFDGTLKRARIRLGAANGIVTNPADVVQELANLVLEDELLAVFRQRISDIDILAGSLASVVIAGDATRATLAGLSRDLTTLKTVVDALSNLEDGSGIATMFERIQEDRIAGDEALSALVGLIGAKSGTSNAFILDLDNVKVTPTESLGQRLTTLKSETDAAQAAVEAEQAARADAISAEATSRTSLAATLREETGAVVLALNQAIADAQGSLAESLSFLQSDFNGLTSSVSTLSQALDGVKARYGVSLDVNGYVTGFVQNNDGKTGSFVILADRFAIVAPGANPTVPFEVSQGEVWVNGQRIRPDSIDVDRLRVTSLSALTANIGFLVSYNGQGGRVERDGNGTRVFGNNGVLRVKMGF